MFTFSVDRMDQYFRKLFKALMIVLNYNTNKTYRQRKYKGNKRKSSIWHFVFSYLAAKERCNSFTFLLKFSNILNCPLRVNIEIPTFVFFFVHLI